MNNIGLETIDQATQTPHCDRVGVGRVVALLLAFDQRGQQGAYLLDPVDFHLAVKLGARQPRLPTGYNFNRMPPLG